MAEALVGWVSNLANIRTAGVTSLKIKLAGGAVPDIAYYNLGNPRDADEKISPLFKPDTMLINKAYGFNPIITIPTVQSALVELKVLDQIALKHPVEVKIGHSDNLSIASTTKLGLKWKLMCAGDMDDFRVIEYTFMSKILKSEMDGLFTITPPADGTPNAADALFTLAQTALIANEKPNGLSKIEMRTAGETAYLDFGDFKMGKYSIECMGDTGGGGRSFPRNSSLKFVFDAIGNQAYTTEINLLDAMASTIMDLKLTHMDGVTFSIDDITLMPTYTNVGNIDKMRENPP